MKAKEDHVLGCRDDELARLAKQHSLWREECQRVWSWAGIAAGSRVLDIGCGPGAAAVDLAERVGSTGVVVGLEISRHYAEHAKRALAVFPCKSGIEVLDLMSDPLPGRLEGQFDFTWSRWVSMFVPKPDLIVDVAHKALVPGGRAIFHEYTHYETYALYPEGSGVRAFVRAAVESIAGMGGDVNTGRRLPALLVEGGFKVERIRAVVTAMMPDDEWWKWPSGFIRTYSPMLVERGQLAPADADKALAELDHAEAAFARGDTSHYMLPPTVIEIVARR